MDVVPRNARISVISIHVLREEDDSISHASYIDQSYFNPRPPRGGRLQQFSHQLEPLISIHVLREEDDPRN